MEPIDIHNFDQVMQGIKEFLIPILKSFYDGCIEQEFNEQQALFLTMEYMKTFYIPK